MRKILVPLLCGSSLIVGLLLTPLLSSLITSSSCPLGKVGAQVNPCYQQEATLERLSFVATREHISAQGTITKLKEQLAPPSTPTISPDVFDISKATLFVSPSGAFQMPLPPGWVDLSGGSDEDFSFVMGDNGDPYTQLRIFVLDRSSLEDFLALSIQVGTAQEAIEAYREDLVPEDYTEISEIVESNVGEYTGFAITYTRDLGQLNSGSGGAVLKIGLRLADIPDTNKTILVVYYSEEAMWEQVNGVVAQMIDGMVFRVDRLPTAVPVKTVRPLPTRMLPP